MQRAVLRGSGDGSQSAASALAFAFLAVIAPNISSVNGLKGLLKGEKPETAKDKPESS